MAPNGLAIRSDLLLARGRVQNSDRVSMGYEEVLRDVVLAGLQTFLNLFFRNVALDKVLVLLQHADGVFVAVNIRLVHFQVLFTDVQGKLMGFQITLGDSQLVVLIGLRLRVLVNHSLLACGLIFRALRLTCLCGRYAVFRIAASEATLENFCRKRKTKVSQRRLDRRANSGAVLFVVGAILLPA